MPYTTQITGVAFLLRKHWSASITYYRFSYWLFRLNIVYVALDRYLNRAETGNTREESESRDLWYLGHGFTTLCRLLAQIGPHHQELQMKLAWLRNRVTHETQFSALWKIRTTFLSLTWKTNSASVIYGLSLEYVEFWTWRIWMKKDSEKVFPITEWIYERIAKWKHRNEKYFGWTWRAIWTLGSFRSEFAPRLVQNWHEYAKDGSRYAFIVSYKLTRTIRNWCWWSSDVNQRLVQQRHGWDRRTLSERQKTGAQ